MTNQQPTVRSTSSRKQHKTICQLRTNTTALFQVDRGKRPKQQRWQRHYSNSKARPPHCLYIPIEYSREKEPPNDAIPGRMHATGFVHGYRLYYLLYDLRVAQLNIRNDFPLVYYVEKLFPVFWCTLPLAISQTKSVCVIERISVWVLFLVSILLARVQTMSMCPNYHTLEAGDAATRNASVTRFLAQ